MSKIKPIGRTRRLALACGATGLLLAACDRGQSASTAPPLDALPLTTAVTASAPAPAASRLPAAPPAQLGRLDRPRDSYAYLDRAYAAATAYSDAPPDYTIDYEGERPWIWRASDNSERVVERTPEGLRYYYYEPGADEPYLVQDGDYTYAYSDGRLVAVYGPDGALQPYEYVQRRADVAGRYLAWAAALYAASRSQQRLAVEQAHWDERRADIAATRAAWNAQQSRDEAWAAYHEAHAAEEQAHWAAEQDRRNAEVVRYADAPPPPPGPRPAASPPFAGGPPPGGFNSPMQAFGGHRFTSPPPGPQGAPPPRLAQGGPPDRPVYDAPPPQAAADAAQAQRRAAFDQTRAQAQAQRQAAAQAHDAQLAAESQAQASRNAAEQQRQQLLQQNRASAMAERQAAEQAHAAQQQAARSALAQQQAVIQQRRAAAAAQQAQASQQQAAHAAADAQRQATLQQARTAALAQRQAAEQAHGAQAAQTHAEAQGPRQPPHDRGGHPAAPDAPHAHPRPGEIRPPGPQP